MHSTVGLLSNREKARTWGISHLLNILLFGLLAYGYFKTQQVNPQELPVGAKVEKESVKTVEEPSKKPYELQVLEKAISGGAEDRKTEIVEKGVIDEYGGVSIVGASKFEGFGKSHKGLVDSLTAGQAYTAGMYADGKTVFAFWGNPVGEATPYFVELCMASIKKNLPKDFRLIIINPDNWQTMLPEVAAAVPAEYKDYMDPKNKKIKIASLKDYILFTAIFKYGGIVIDSTSIALPGGMQKLWDDFSAAAGKEFMTYIHNPCVEKNSAKYSHVECTAVWYMMAKPQNKIGKLYEAYSNGLMKTINDNFDEWKKRLGAKKEPNKFAYLAYGAIALDQIIFQCIAERPADGKDIKYQLELPTAEELMLLDAWDMARSPQMYEFGVDPYDNQCVLFDWLKMDLAQVKANNFRRYCMLEQRMKNKVPFLKFQAGGGCLKDTIFDCKAPYNQLLLSRVFDQSGIFEGGQCEPVDAMLDMEINAAGPAMGYGQAKVKAAITEEMQAGFLGHFIERAETQVGGKFDWRLV